MVLGTATPSLETLRNARSGRYQELRLTDRPGSTRHPDIRLIDLDAGTSPATPDTVQVQVQNQRTRHLELVVLTETGVSTGIFTGTLVTVYTSLPTGPGGGRSGSPYLPPIRDEDRRFAVVEFHPRRSRLERHTHPVATARCGMP